METFTNFIFSTWWGTLGTAAISICIWILSIFVFCLMWQNPSFGTFFKHIWPISICKTALVPFTPKNKSISHYLFDCSDCLLKKIMQGKLYLSAMIPIPTAVACRLVSLNILCGGRQIGMIVSGWNLVLFSTFIPESGSTIG